MTATVPLRHQIFLRALVVRPLVVIEPGVSKRIEETLLAGKDFALQGREDLGEVVLEQLFKHRDPQEVSGFLANSGDCPTEVHPHRLWVIAGEGCDSVHREVSGERVDIWQAIPRNFEELGVLEAGPRDEEVRYLYEGKGTVVSGRA